MEDCSTQISGAGRALSAKSVATASRVQGPGESTIMAIRSFARAYRAVRLRSVPQAPGIVLN